MKASEDATFELLSLTCEVNEYGDKIYRNKEGDLHRIHGPALIYENGEEWWYKNDRYYAAYDGDHTYHIGESLNVVTYEEFVKHLRVNGFLCDE